MMSAFGVDHGDYVDPVAKGLTSKIPRGAYSYSHATRVRDLSPGGPAQRETQVIAHSTGRLIPKHEIGHLTVNPSGEIGMIRVRSWHRRRGVGSTMVDHARRVHPTPVRHSASRTLHGERFARGMEAKAGRPEPPPSQFFQNVSDDQLRRMQNNHRANTAVVVAGSGALGAVILHDKQRYRQADRARQR